MGLVNDAVIAAVDLNQVDVKMQTFHPAGAASSTVYIPLIVCPADEGIVIEAATSIWTTAAGTSGTLDLVKVASGTAASSGTSILTGTTNIAGTAATITAVALDPTKNFLVSGQILYAKIVHGGTVSVGLTVPIRWRPITRDVNYKG